MSPDRERDGWSTPHSVVLMVTDDMPFLVDTMRMLLERHGLDIHLLVHPMLLVERDAVPTMIQRVAPFSDRLAGTAADSSLLEAWTQIEIDRIDDEMADALETRAGGGGRRRPPRGRRLRPDAGPAARSLVHVHPATAVVRRRPVRVPRRHRHDLRRVGDVTPIAGTGLGQLADADPGDARRLHVLDVGRRGRNGRP